MFKIILIALAAIVAGLVVFIAIQPSEFQIQRTATITAPASAVFEQVNDLHNFHTWSPWSERDPDQKLNFSGAPNGVGSSYQWVGNKEVGEGNLTITENHPNDRIQMNLNFLKPFPASNIVDFTFEPKGDQTAVTWRLSGKNDFMAKAFSLIMNMDKMVGNDFEAGLANLERRLNS